MQIFSKDAFEFSEARIDVVIGGLEVGWGNLTARERRAWKICWVMKEGITSGKEGLSEVASVGLEFIRVAAGEMEILLEDGVFDIYGDVEMRCYSETMQEQYH